MDPDGHFAFVPFLIAVGLLTLKAVDYGWTAYDIYQSGKVLNDPSASSQEKEAAAATIATANAFEAAEPDDALPGGLPIDDIARKITKEPGDELATVVNNAVRGFPTPPTVVKSEIRSPNPVRPSIATDLWDEFLGNGPYNNKNPITGLPDANRIFSTDGIRSIRYGSHEIKYNHYHEEIWSYDSNTK